MKRHFASIPISYHAKSKELYKGSDAQQKRSTIETSYICMFFVYNIHAYNAMKSERADKNQAQACKRKKVKAKIEGRG